MRHGGGRTRRGLVVLGAAVVLFVGVGVSSGDDSTAVSSDRDRKRVVASEPATTLEATSTPSTEPAALAVRSITDGDTFVLADGRRVRLAQVDAPETSECFGSESTAALRTMIDGTTVELRRPATGPATDRYGRTLADVIVAGVSVNEALVASGAAEWYEEFADEDADLARRMQAAEAAAQSAGLGLWSGCKTTAVPPPAPAPPVTQALITPTTSGASSTPSGNCHPAYPDDCIPPSPPDLDCPDIGRKVRVDRAHGDPHRLDGNDDDGWGCESYG